MSKKNNDHSADINNANKGTPGTNITFDKNQGNRGKQMNPNQAPKPVPSKPSGGKKNG